VDFKSLIGWMRRGPDLHGIPKADLPKIGDSVRIVGDKANTTHKIALITNGGLKIFLKGITGYYSPDSLIKILNKIEKKN